MEHINKRSYLQKGLLVLGVLVLVIVSILLYPKTKKELPELAQYLPASTVFALRADRDAIMANPHRLIGASDRLQGWREQSRTYWQDLEQATGLHIATLMIVVTEDRGILWQSILFTTPDTITDRKATDLMSGEFGRFSWYPTPDALRFQRIALHSGALVSTQDTEDYTTPSSESAKLLASDPVALFAKRDIAVQLADRVGLEQAIPGIGQLINSQPQTRAGFSLTGPMIRSYWYDAIPLTTVIAPIQVPTVFDLAFAGDMTTALEDTTSLTHPVAAALHSFINAQASIFSFNPDDLENNMKPLRAILISGDQWLMAGEDTAKIVDLVSLFIGARTPKRASGRLPDGSPYREIVRGMPTPRIEDAGGYKVSIWSDASLTASSTDSQALYTSEKGGMWYLSTSKDLLGLQFGQVTGSDLSDYPLVQACQPASGQEKAEVEEVWVAASRPDTDANPQDTKLIYISQKSQENQSIHSLCVQ